MLWCFAKRSTFGKQVGLIQISNCYMRSYLVDNNAYFHVISFLFFFSFFFSSFSHHDKVFILGILSDFFPVSFFFSKHGQISRFLKQTLLLRVIGQKSRGQRGKRRTGRRATLLEGHSQFYPNLSSNIHVASLNLKE